MEQSIALRTKRVAEPDIEQSVSGFTISESEVFKLSHSWRKRLSGKVMNESNSCSIYCTKCGNRVSPRPSKAALHECKSVSSKFALAQSRLIKGMLNEQARRLAELQTGSR